MLGAGASIGAERYPVRSSIEEQFPHMPSSENFFYDLARGGSKRRRKVRDLNMLGLMYEGAEWLIRTAWGLGSDARVLPVHWRGVNVESALTFADVGARMYSRGSTYARGFRNAREALVQYVVDMLSFKCDGQHCELLQELCFTLRPTDSIISFNYDTIADFTLQANRLQQFRNYVKLMSGGLPTVRGYERKGVLLKLHGSVNWQDCRQRTCRYHKRPHIAFARRNKLPERAWGRGSCDGCGDERPHASIVPPLSEKNLSKHDFFHRLWLIARAQLPRFNRLVFIGYSFPPTDPYSEWLFRQVHFMTSRRRPTIIVANPAALLRHGPVRARYESIFRGCNLEYHRDLASLVEHVRHPQRRSA